MFRDMTGFPPGNTRGNTLPGPVPHLAPYCLGVRFNMPKYLYILSGDGPFSETDLNSMKEEICRLFKCTDVTVSGEKVLTLQSPLGPADIEHLAAETSKRFHLQFKAGGQVD